MFLAPWGSFVMAPRMSGSDLMDSDVAALINNGSRDGAARPLTKLQVPALAFAHTLIQLWFADLLMYAPIVMGCLQSGFRLANYLPDVDLLATWLLASARIREFALLFGMDYRFVYFGTLS